VRTVREDGARLLERYAPLDDDEFREDRDRRLA